MSMGAGMALANGHVQATNDVSQGDAILKRLQELPDDLGAGKKRLP